MSGSVDARAIQSLAREIWTGLTLAQRDALRRARGIEGGYALSMPTHMLTVRSLWAKDSEAAKRRFSRRKERRV